jgi:hypothetical protein
VKVKAKVTAITRWSICLLCFIGMLRMDVSAEGGIEFHVNNQMGKAGEVVTVPVELHSGEQVGGFDIKVYYDPESMEFQELQKGELIQDDGLFDYNHKAEEAAVKIVYVVSDTVAADGTIANLVFKLKRDCESLPIGMGLKEVIDGSEQGNVVAGQVTGTDPAYQEQAERRVVEESPAVEENPADAQGEGVQEESQGEEKQGEGVQEESQEEEKRDKGAQGGEAEKETLENDFEESGVNRIIIALISAVVIIIVALVIWRRKVRKSQ